MATSKRGDDTRHTDLAACQKEIDNLRAFLQSRPVSDQAKGILMAQHGCTADEAFQMLCEASQRNNRKLRDLASDIVASVQGQPAQRQTG
jgi:two-component system, response regulator / RNA-binding antiterminator